MLLGSVSTFVVYMSLVKHAKVLPAVIMPDQHCFGFRRLALFRHPSCPLLNLTVRRVYAWCRALLLQPLISMLSC